MELDGFNEEIKLPQKGKKKAYEVEYDDFTQQAVEGLMKADVDHIISLFGVDVSGLRLFLPFQRFGGALSRDMRYLVAC